jgi:hypothetical protein
VIATEPATTTVTEPSAAQVPASTAVNGSTPSTTKPALTAPESATPGANDANSNTTKVDPVAPGALRGGWTGPIEP